MNVTTDSIRNIFLYVNNYKHGDDEKLRNDIGNN
jgi:hypothetical protein